MPAARRHHGFLEDDVSTFRKAFASFEELSIGGLLLLLAAATTFQVITRYFFDTTYDWLAEASRYLTMLAAFAGAGLAVKHGAHFSMEAMIHFMPERAKAAVRSLAFCISAVVMAVVSYQAYIQISKLAKYGMTTASLGLPMWVAYTPILVFGLVISVRFLIESVKFLRTALKPAPQS